MSAIIELKDVNLAYTASQTMALEDVNLVIPRGSRTAIVGPNGAGKSSLFKVILGLEKPDTGQVRMLGQEAGLERLIARKVAYIPQSSQVNWQFPATVFEIVLMGRFAHSKGMFRRPTKADRQIVEQALERLKIADLRHRPGDDVTSRRRPGGARLKAHRTAGDGVRRGHRLDDADAAPWPAPAHLDVRLGAPERPRSC